MKQLFKQEHLAGIIFILFIVLFGFLMVQGYFNLQSDVKIHSAI